MPHAGRDARPDPTDPKERRGRTGCGVRARRLVDLTAVLGCLALIPIIHPIGPLLRQQYWLDEAWVALSAKAPTLDLPWVTASSPLGWTALVSSLPAYGQIQRLIPLVFLAATVVVAYAFGRSLGWPSRSLSVIAGLAGAAATLLLPAQLVRLDLKQYTADAAVALLLFALAAWAESTWSRRRLAVLGAAIVVGMLFSHPAAFVGGAVLAGLVVTAAASRRAAPEQPASGQATAGQAGSKRSTRLRHSAALVLVSGLGMVCVYLLVDRPGHTSELSTFWSPYFPLAATLPSYLPMRLDALRPALGLAWQAFLLLAAVGVVTVARLLRPATATALALLPLIAMAAGVTRRYPLLDQRTSHFVLVTCAVTAAIGLAGIGAGIGVAVARVAGVGVGGAEIASAEGAGGGGAGVGGAGVGGAGVGGAGVGVAGGGVTATGRLPVLARPGVRAALAGGLVLLAMAGFAVANWTRLADPPPPGVPRENVRVQVKYVAGHRGPADVILVNMSGQYGFAYYWSGNEPQFHRGGVQATGWHVDYPPADRIVVAADRDLPAIAKGVAAAEQLAGPGGTIWLVRTHVVDAEAQAWQQALAGRRVQVLPVGPEPLAVLTASPSQPINCPHHELAGSASTNALLCLSSKSVGR